MSDEITPEFFVPDATGDSVAVYKTLVDSLENLQSSELKARGRQAKSSNFNTFALDGIPGIPFEASAPNPDVFYQSEDVIYDMYLFHDGQPVSSETYDITASVKTSPRARTNAWEGSIDAGVYAIEERPGFYELWIPSTATETFIAGTYYLQIQIKEKTGPGRFPRRFVLLTSHFNIDYSNFSANPESRSSSGLRGSVEPTWPNSPNTVGGNNIKTTPISFTTT